MAIVSPDPERAPESAHDAPLLEVVVLHPRDADAATRGEADRLLVLSGPEVGGRSPEPAVVSSILRETDLDVRVLLDVDGATPERVVDLAETCLGLGAAGVSFGFLDRDLEIDRETCTAVTAALPGIGWTFHRGFDQALDQGRAWRDVAGLPGLDAVTSAGSTRGLAVGGDELIRRAAGDVRVARLLLASGGLTAEHVPWLIRAGVRQFGLGEEARLDGSWTRSYVDPGAVRAWRLLLDDAHQRALGVPVDLG